ncbi:hypothetical protein ACL2XO_11830 [Sodalis sp. RH15]|uniref:hypothetical protein n=1 Tax=Sodalis sp. RH15 TaxID=3394330 RepID=UPI0039B5928B
MKSLSCANSAYPTTAIPLQQLVETRLTQPSIAKSSVGNAYVAYGKKKSFNNIASCSPNNVSQHLDAEEIKADRLFSCVEELNRHPDSLLRTHGSKYITLHFEEKRRSVFTKIVALPSGREIYVGNLSGKMIISDGEIYHLPPSSVNHYNLGCSLMLAWAGLSTAYCQPALQYGSPLRETDGHPGGYPRRQTETTSLFATLQFAGRSWIPLLTVWKNILAGPVDNLLKAFTLPGAAAQETPVDQNDVFEEEWPNDIKDLINDEITPVPMLNGCNPSPGEPYDEQYFLVHKTLTVVIDEIKTRISMPHHDAQRELEHVLSVFQLSTGSASESLDMLLSFDKYVGEKVQDIFDKGNIYAKETKCVHLILLKGKIEKIINECKERQQASVATRDAINKYEKSQIKIRNLLKLDIDKLMFLHDDPDKERIYETIEYKKGVTFSEAKNNIHMLYKNVIYEQKEKYVKYYKTLLLMEHAKLEYCNELYVVPGFTVLERILYKNDMQLLKSLLQENNERIDNLIKKRYFYKLYDFTRENGVSLQGENLLIPGELSKFNVLFDVPEHEIDEIEFLNTFTSEITNYLSLRTEHGSILGITLKVIELLRITDDPEMEQHQWHEINIKPFYQAKKLFQDIIHLSLNRNIYTRMPATWNNDHTSQLIKDKMSFIYSDILIFFQMDFNKIVKNILQENRFIVVETEEQRITEAKFAAVAQFAPIDFENDDYDSRLIYYKNMIDQGYIILLLWASAYWYISKIKAEKVSHRLLDVHALNVARQFIEQENNIAAELNMAGKATFSSLYTLKPSSEFDDKRDYYDQFIYYKMLTINKESKFKSFFAIKNSLIGYYDLLYPPQEAYTFKVYSRKYIQNTLANAPSVSIPVTNLGFLSIVKTKTDRLVLISTLADFTYISIIDELYSTELISRLMSQWKSAPNGLQARSRAKFSVSMSELQLLFFLNQPDDRDNPLDMLLVTPEENDYSNPTPEITFAAFKEIDLEQNLRSFIDTLNFKTLLEVSMGLKTSLLRPTWIDFITMHIPFYRTIERYWQDNDMTLKFEDVVFDIFDLIIALIPTGISLSRIPQNFIAMILKSAKDQNIPKHMLKQFFIGEFIKLAPQMSFSSAKKISGDLLKFINPLPLTVRGVGNLPTLCYNGIKKNIQFVNSRTKAQKFFQQNLRKEWSMKIGPDKLKPLWDGIYTDSALIKNTRHYIKDRDDIFQVQRDEIKEVWRVLDPNNDDIMGTAIAVVPHGKDNWEISPIDVGIESPMILDQFSTLATQNVIPDIQFESAVSLQMPSADEDFHSEQCQKILTFFMTENEYFLNDMLSSHFSKDDILLALADRLTGNVPKDDVFSRGGYTTLQDLMIHEFYSLPAKFETAISYRAINFWVDKWDNNPINHFLIKYIIGKNAYIIDLQAIRPPKNLNNSNSQVYSEQEWLRKYKNDVPPEFALIKYKDYSDIKDALQFSQNKDLSPSATTEDSYLIREPAWYQSTVLQNSQYALKMKYPIFSVDTPSFRVICRKAIRRLYGKTPFEALPPKILAEANHIDAEQAEALLNHLTVSKSSILPAGTILDSGLLVPNLDILTRINPGKLVLFYDQKGLLMHSQVSIGNGRFASADNTFFDPRLPDHPAILVAEELGIFRGVNLKLRHNDMELSVITGNVKGVEETSSTIASPLMKKKILAVKGDDPEPVEKWVPVSREESLLGEHWEIIPMGGLKSHIQIKVHGMPFNVNYMDATEFSHVVRGLMLSKPEVYNLSQLKHIDLYSCFSGFGGKYSMAQVLANELQVQIKAYPYYISQAIERRHPSWFTTYRPMGADDAGNKNRYVYARHNTQLQSIITMHTHLHDFIAYLAHLRRKFRALRQKRSRAGDPPSASLPYIPSIQTDLAKLILGERPLHEFIIDFDIGRETESALRELLTDYLFDEERTDDVFFQVYFDIIFTIERFRDIGNVWQRFTTD